MPVSDLTGLRYPKKLAVQYLEALQRQETAAAHKEKREKKREIEEIIEE